MTSLQSSHSAFSSLSIGTNQSSLSGSHHSRSVEVGQGQICLQTHYHRRVLLSMTPDCNAIDLLECLVIASLSVLACLLF